MSSTASSSSRRQFLRHAALLAGTTGPGALPVALNLAAMNAAAASTAGDYKAIVCVFLHGGNDAANMVLPTDAASWAAYEAVRGTGADPIALRAPGTPMAGGAARGSPAALGGVLPITPGYSQFAVNAARTFAVHPLLGNVQGLFQQERLAVVANVGPLVVPVTRAEVRAKAKPVPSKLGSHNDQQSTWQALAPEGVTAGWGGRMGDLLAATNANATFTSISVAGNAVFSAGRQISPFQVANGGAVPIDGMSGALFGSYAGPAAYRAILTQGGAPDAQANLLAREYAAVAKRNVDQQAAFNSAYLGATVLPTTKYMHPVSGVATTNPLAEQLRSVARIVGARDGLGARRQVFFVGLGGFDTHDWQNLAHADLMARLDHALAYFDAAMGAAGMRDQVTLFTASEFGRTFSTNGDGTDHGWGAHHFVLGGAVRGREVYGRFPQVGLNHDDDGGSGAFIPQVSVDQLGATLGRWFGVGESDLDLVFPNLRHFGRDLGFLRGV